MSAHSLDINADQFETEVLDASRQAPVIVDFWAPWCAPCRSLKPTLEKLAEEYQGRFRLVKINTDENLELARAAGVRGIPNVKAFVGGNYVNEFTGAQSEGEVRRFLDGLLQAE